MSTNKYNLKNLLFSTLQKVISTYYPTLLKLEEEFNCSKDKDTFFLKNTTNTEAIICLQQFIQYTTIKLLLNNLINNLEFVAEYKKKYDNFIINKDNIDSTTLLKKLTGITFDPVLTAHPTEPLSHEMLYKVSKLHIYLEENSASFDDKFVAALLLELIQTPLTPKCKLSVEDEVKDNLEYFYKLYQALPILINRIVETFSSSDIKTIKKHNFMRPRSWTGGDADGNPNITALTMINAVEAQSKAVIAWHIKVLNQLILKDIPDFGLYKNIMQLRLLLVQYHGDIKNIEENYKSFIAFFNNIMLKNEAALKQYPNIRTMLENFSMQLTTFGFHLALIDVRQNARVYDEVYLQISKFFKKPITYTDIIQDSSLKETLFKAFKENKFLKDYPLIQTEFLRIEAIAKFPRIFSNLIISDTQNISDILNPAALCRIFKVNPTIVPLFETIEAITNARSIMQACLNNSHYQDIQGNKPIKIMLGYSDSEKEAGIFILPLIEKVTTDIKKHFEKQNLELSIFHGNGLDLSRGGPTIFESEQTIQGNQKRYLFNTVDNTLIYFFHTLNFKLHKIEDTFLPEVTKLAESSVISFKDLFKEGDNLSSLENYLSSASPYWLFVKTNNFSSRPSSRKTEDSKSAAFKPWLTPKFYPSGEVLSGIRAISQVNTIEGTFLNFNLWYGLEEFLNATEPSKLNNLLTASPVVYDLLLKSLIGIELIDLDLARQFFPAEVDNKFFLTIEQKYNSLMNTINKLNLKLPIQVVSELSSKKDYANPIKHFISFACKHLVYKSVNYHPKTIRELFPSDLTEEKYLELITNLFGAAYCGFTEYRTPPYSLLDVSFTFLLQSNNLQKGKDKS
ncbi:hypothetical protein NF27_DP00620 [Candidatus Jidaibacter acanthamoeba]|uniref:Phosphoenolpyruvate carboxylase n=1 Tax=Candidatus Jidaibacter acanthamoebae TaxID=86105 RepID=A0A0C1QNC1_9RICK|nr:phosphoenolpyruvate carboxylase [Candidatus Jidaibacter acanthamoeba]KIE05518.1 hypothetical protein NF27_DP00620 [Candidatus Jidaibacter acanthamoeba]